MLVLIWLLSLFVQEIPAAWREAAAQYESDIKKFEELDRAAPDPRGALLLVGSSSIRLWDTAEEDLAPWPVIRRGFGGCTFSDVLIYAPRLIPPHQFAGLVLFCANDIRGENDDKSPAEVAHIVRQIIDTVRQSHATEPILVVEITPTRKRWQSWPQIEDANRRIEAVCKDSPGVYFVTTASHYLSDQGEPREELFVDDLLHQNRDGYRQWGRLIRDALERAGVPKP
jgi:lysophospholipase L1-like esterase